MIRTLPLKVIHASDGPHCGAFPFQAWRQKSVPAAVDHFLDEWQCLIDHLQTEVQELHSLQMEACENRDTGEHEVSRLLWYLVLLGGDECCTLSLHTDACENWDIGGHLHFRLPILVSLYS